MKIIKKSRKRRIITIIISVIFCLVIAIVGMYIYGKIQMRKIPGLTFTEALEYTTHDNPDAVITVEVIKDGQISYTVYGENAEVLPTELHTYEIGSLTKTFTAALVNKAIRDGRINIGDTIDNYLSLPEGNNYPTIEELLTHTSGYKGYYFQSPMIGNFFKGRNDFYGITKDMVLNKVSSLDMDKDSYDFNYSNFGYAVLGLVLEKVYDTDYTILLNSFLKDELGLSATQISDQSGDLDNYWDWRSDDAYIPAGAITSNIEDMLTYAQMQIEDNEYFEECHNSLKTVNAVSDDYKTMGIYMDEIGMAWIIDNENGIIWHNGGTGDYNSYLGFDPESGNAVVILSNLLPNYRIPATVMGITLLSQIRE